MIFVKIRSGKKKIINIQKYPETKSVKPALYMYNLHDGVLECDMHTATLDVNIIINSYETIQFWNSHGIFQTVM